ncbi:MAG: hypothetical protein KKB50_06955 [Planctomycetes bacterium]|nr:hypothetical protein [Planctomycetota bacterium]
MNENVTTRPAPHVVCVPPPDGPGLPIERVRGPLVACLIGGGLCFMLVVGGGGTVWQWLLIMAVIYVGVAIVVVVHRALVNRAYRVQQQTFREKRGNDRSDPLIAALCQAWPTPDRVPTIDAVRAALRAAPGADTTERAWIVCFGEADVPEVGALHFEPEIVTPTGAVWRQLIWLAIAGVPATWCLLDVLHLLPGWIPPTRSFIGCFAYFLTAGIMALAIWVWRGMIRPTYLRLAPGIIQVLQYRFRADKPTIRSYPMEPGTLAVFTRIRKRQILALSRSEQSDTLAFSQMRHTQLRVDQTWRALLSSASTPPLSTDELLG